MNIADALSGPAQRDGIQWMLLSATTRRVFRDQLKALLPASAMLGPCRLRHAIFRPGRKLKAYYDARVRVEGTKGYRVRPIAVTWRSDGEADWRQGRDALTEMQAEAVRQGVAAPFRQLTAELPEWGMHIQVSPLDAQFLPPTRSPVGSAARTRHARGRLRGEWCSIGSAPARWVRRHLYPLPPRQLSCPALRPSGRREGRGCIREASHWRGGSARLPCSQGRGRLARRARRERGCRAAARLRG